MNSLLTSSNKSNPGISGGKLCSKSNFYTSKYSGSKDELTKVSKMVQNCPPWVGAQWSHLSKRTCDLKQNGTQEKAPFSGIVFCALALGVVCFVPSVSSRNHFLIGQNSSFSQWEASIWWFQKLTVGTKRTTPQERQWETVPENSVFSWVPFCLRSLGPFERCATFFPCTTFYFQKVQHHLPQGWNTSTQNESQCLRLYSFLL